MRRTLPLWLDCIAVLAAIVVATSPAATQANDSDPSTTATQTVSDDHSDETPVIDPAIDDLDLDTQLDDQLQPDPDEADDAESAIDSSNSDGPLNVGWMELSGPLRDAPPPFAWVHPEEQGTSLRRVVRQLQMVASDDDYAGVVINLQDAQLRLTQIDEMATAIDRVREAGKKVIVFSDHYDLRLYLLACGADQILLQHKGMIELSGIGIEEIYLAGLLEKLGMRADLIQVGRFKGANEQLMRSGPSDAWNENIGSLLDGLYGHILDRVARGRGLTRDQVEALLADSWAMTDEQYLERGMIDALTDRDMIDVTGDHFGDNFEWQDLLDWQSDKPTADNPFALFRMMFQEPQIRVRRPSIAVIHAHGPIHSGESGTDGAFGGESIGSSTLSRALTEVKDNDLIKGAIIRIDSPGGSALASELIWQEVRQVTQDKPVFISVASSALSGGYYIACAGDEIYVSPSTIVGSIGVVGGKVVIGQLYNKLGVTVHRRSRGPWGDMFNSVEPFTNEQRQALMAAFNRVYDQFTERVKIGRGQRVEDITTVAEGRLFVGPTAVQLGLADKIGGLDAAIADLAILLGLEAGRYDLVDLPEPQSLSQFLENLFDASSAHPVTSSPIGGALVLDSIRQVLGEPRWRAISPVLSGLMLLRQEPILTLVPAALLID